MNSRPLRIVFAGTPDFAAIHLRALLGSRHEIIAAYTQPDRPAGRGKKLQPSAVKMLAESAGVRVYQPATLKTQDAEQTLAALKADVMIVVAYGLILPQAILDTPTLGCLNVHASLLPRWRGAAPIQRAIEAGDHETGITIMQMDAGLDTGDILACDSCTIGPQTNSATLHDELAELGAPLLLKILDDLPSAQANVCAQPDNGTTYAQKILKPEALINWNHSAKALDLVIRAFNPFPVAYTLLGETRLKIYSADIAPDSGLDLDPGTITRADASGIRVHCGEQELCITRLQIPGGKVLSAAQVLNARSDLFPVGARFGA
jgi:methionyl-tRNA formyltransferase